MAQWTSRTVMAGNLIWNTPAAPNGIGISVGVRPWTAEYSYNGHGIQVQDNSSGQEGIWAGNGVVVSGMLDATVTGNDLNVHVVDGAPACTTAAEGTYRRCGDATRRRSARPGRSGWTWRLPRDDRRRLRAPLVLRLHRERSDRGAAVGRDPARPPADGRVATAATGRGRACRGRAAARAEGLAR